MSTEVGNPSVQLAKNNIASVAPQNFRLRNQWDIPHFIGITQDELAGFPSLEFHAQLCLEYRFAHDSRGHR